MRIDLPGCGFKNCRYNSDCNCTNQNRYETCEYRDAKDEIETLNNIIKEDCGMLPDYEAYLGNKIRKEFAERLKDDSYESDLYDRDERWVRGVTIEDIDTLLKEMEEK